MRLMVFLLALTACEGKEDAKQATTTDQAAKEVSAETTGDNIVENKVPVSTKGTTTTETTKNSDATQSTGTEGTNNKNSEENTND